MYIISRAWQGANPVTIAASSTLAFQTMAGEPGAGAQLNVSLESANVMNGYPFTVRAAGYFAFAAQTVTTAATPLEVGIYGSNTASFAAAAGNLLTAATVAAFTLASASTTYGAFEVEAMLVAANGGDLAGVGQGFGVDANGASTANARVATTHPITGMNFASDNPPPASFAVALVTPGSVNLTGVAYLTNLVIEA